MGNDSATRRQGRVALSAVLVALALLPLTTPAATAAPAYDRPGAEAGMLYFEHIDEPVDDEAFHAVALMGAVTAAVAAIAALWWFLLIRRRD